MPLKITIEAGELPAHVVSTDVEDTEQSKNVFTSVVMVKPGQSKTVHVGKGTNLRIRQMVKASTPADLNKPAA